MVSHETLLHALPPRVQWPIVGREAEVALLVHRMADGSGGVVVVGAPGLGKSTVVAAALTELEDLGHTVVRLPAPHERGTSASVVEQWLGVPVPSVAPVDLVAGQVAAALLTPPTGEAPIPPSGKVPILGLDDLHLLDGFSAAVLGRLLQTGKVRLVGTSREDPGLPAAIDTLWRSGHLDRSDLVPLSYEAIRLILRAALPGPASNDMAYRLWLATAGNPLHVRELLYSIVEAGDVTYAEQAWIWIAPLRTNRRLTDLLASDIGVLTGPARDVVDLVALAETVPLAALAPSATDDVLRFLVERGLIVISEGPGAAKVSIGHPLYAETLRSLLYPRRKRELFDLIPEPLPGREGPQQLSRWVEWALECEIVPSVSALLAAGAALESLAQPEKAVTMATIALGHTQVLPLERVAALLLRARSNRDAGWSQSAEADLALLAGLVDEANAGPAVDEGVTVRMARIQADIRQMHYRDLNGALEGLAAAAKALDPAGIAATELAVEQLGRLGYGGRHAEVLAGWAPQVAAADLPANVTMAPSYVYALAQAGKPLAALAFAETHMQLVGPEHGEFPLARTALVAARFWAALWSGQPELALQGPEYVEDGIQRHHSAVYQTGAGYLCLVFGSWDQAVAELRGGLSRMSISAPSGLEAMAWAGLAQAYAVRGERNLALQACEQYRDLAPTLNRSVETDSRHRMLLAHYALGQTDLAGQIQDYLDWAGGEGLALGVLLGRHLMLVQAGQGDRAELLPALESAAGEVEGLLPGALLAHAKAVMTGDPGVITTAVAALNRVGIWLSAPVQLEELTLRQREIAGLAAVGMSNKSIAHKLQISVRTVDTHMGHIFQRMGITKRSDLAAALSGAAAL